jgi:hypothetical protein
VCAAITAVFLCLSFGSVQAAKSFKLDGFKDIKLGMATSDLRVMGFECADDSRSCQLKDGGSNKWTLFGQSARVTANFTDQIIDEIGVTIDITDNKMIEQFTSTLGAPQTHEYVSFMGYKVRKYFWVSNNKTSIVVTRNLDKTHQKNIFGQTVPMNFSTAQYLSEGKTRKLLDEMKKGKLDNKDF